MLTLETFHGMFDTLAQGVVMLDPDLRMRAVNQAHCRQLGLKEEDVIGLHCYSLHHCAAYSFSELRDLACVRGTGRSPPSKTDGTVSLCRQCPLKYPGMAWKRPVPAWIRLADGRNIPVLLTYSRLSDEDDQTTGFLLFLHPLEGLHRTATRTRDELHRVGQELRMAAQVERELEPGRQESVPGLEIGAASLPFRPVGGDQVEWFARGQGDYVLVVADLSSKSLPASLLLPALRRACHEVLTGAPQDAALRLNHRLVAELPQGMFAAVTLVFYPGSGNAMWLANAGNEAPWVYRRRSGQADELVDCLGLVLGVVPHQTWPAVRVELEPGDVLVASTDGLGQALDLRGWTYADLLEPLAAAPRGQLQHTVRRLLRGMRRLDDVTLLALRLDC